MSMTAQQVEQCYTSRIGTPGSPQDIVPNWITAFGQDGLPPPPSLFVNDQAAYAWIASNWTDPNPCGSERSGGEESHGRGKAKGHDRGEGEE